MVNIFHCLLSFHRYSIACPGFDMNLANHVWFDDEERSGQTMPGPEAGKMCTVSYKKEREAGQVIRHNLHEPSNLEEELYLMRI